MTSKVPWWRREAAWAPLLAAAAALFVLFPLLGTFGLWDPQEIAIADRARDALRDGRLSELIRGQPPLTLWLVAWSVDLLGPSELAARLPLALLGLIGAAATYGLGAHLRRPRAGMIAAIALVTSPLYLFQSRQLTSDIGALAAHALAALAIARLLWPRRRSALALAGDAALAVVGLGLGFVAAGALLGVFLPLAAAAIAGVATLNTSDGEVKKDRTRSFFTLVFALGAVVVLGAILERIFEIIPAQPGQLALFGKTLKADTKYSMLLGGAWRHGLPPADTRFANLIEQVAFGMFPWSAAAPLAVLGLVRPATSARRELAQTFVLVFALVTYLVSAYWLFKVGPLRYPGLPLIAVAIALWLDDVIATRLEGQDSVMPGASGGLPIAAAFVLLAAGILALDLRNEPETLASLHLASPVKWPQEIVLRVAPAAFGILFGVLVAAALVAAVPAQKRFVRTGAWGALSAAAVFGLFLSAFYMPRLSVHFSYKNVFEAYMEHRQGDEPLGIMGIPGKGPEFYAQGTLTQVRDLNDAARFLGGKQRVFLISSSDRLCSLHELALTRKTRYHVLDDANTRYMLVTNQLADGETDRNPLRQIFHREPPKRFDRPITANFDDTIELLGVDMPAEVDKGDRFTVRLWFRVLKRPAENWKVFLHFDQGAIRFQGDHEPARCGMTYWQPGDIIADSHELTAAGEVTHPRGRYTLMAGFFKGSSGVYTNMPVKTPEKDQHNRVPLGTIKVD